MALRSAIIALLALQSTAQNCTVCPDGSPVNATIQVPNTGGNCQDLQLLAADANETECAKIQRNAAWCACPGVEPSCTLCHDGSMPSKPNLVVQVGNESKTCLEVAHLATIASNASTCQELSVHAMECGCPTPFCTLCPDGQSPPNKDYVLDRGATCLQLDAIAQHERSQEGCNALRNYAAVSCGCTVEITSSDSSCKTLCPDGSQVPDKDAVAGITRGNKTITCGELQAQAALETVQDRNMCHMYMQVGVHACGCPNTLPPVACSICEDGSSPPNLLLDVDGAGNTCANFMASMSYVNEEQQCRAFQATAGVYCGCDNPDASQGACRLCPESNDLNQTRMADRAAQKHCSEIEYIANLSKEPQVCSHLQTVFNTCCGPEQLSQWEDGLVYSDDLYIDATLPPAIAPGGSYHQDDDKEEEEEEEEDTANQDASGAFQPNVGFVVFMTILLLAAMALQNDKEEKDTSDKDGAGINPFMIAIFLGVMIGAMPGNRRQRNEGQ